MHFHPCLKVVYLFCKVHILLTFHCQEPLYPIWLNICLLFIRKVSLFIIIRHVLKNKENNITELHCYTLSLHNTQFLKLTYRFDMVQAGSTSCKWRTAQHNFSKLLHSNYESQYWEQSIAYLQWVWGSYRSPWTSKHKLKLEVNFYCLIKALIKSLFSWDSDKKNRSSQQECEL